MKRRRAAHKLATRVHCLIDGRFQPSALDDCAETLAAGGVVVVPTDTVYGVACGAFNLAAIRRVYQLKGRRYDKPLPVLIHDARLLNLVASEVCPEAAPLIERYWPGPLTLVVKTGPLATAAARGKSTIAVRVPDHGVLRDLLERAGIPVAATSANRSGRPEVTDGAEAVRLFGGEVDIIIDGGRCPVGRPSSVVDVTHFPFVVLREGAVSKRELERCLRVA